MAVSLKKVRVDFEVGSSLSQYLTCKSEGLLFYQCFLPRPFQCDI